MDLTLRMIKCILIIANSLIAIAGLGLLVAGALIHLQVAKVSDFLSSKLHAPPILLIIIGTAIFGIAAFGYCGARRENFCCLVVYGSVLLVILLVEVIFAGLVFAYRNDFEEASDEKLEDAIVNYDSNKEEVDSLQQTFRCCGYTSFTDYRRLDLPSSCCSSGEDSCTPTSGDLYTSGCKKALHDFVQKSGKIMGAVALGFCVLEVLGIIFAFLLASVVH